MDERYSSMEGSPPIEDLGGAIELCCGPTTICGHHQLPELLDSAIDEFIEGVDDKTRRRGAMGVQCCRVSFCLVAVMRNLPLKESEIS